MDFIYWGHTIPLPDFYLCENQHRLMLSINEAEGGFYQAYDLTAKKWQTFDGMDYYCAPTK